MQELVVFGDLDKSYAGHKAAYSLAHKAAIKGILVSVRFPDNIGDFNDVLRNG